MIQVLAIVSTLYVNKALPLLPLRCQHSHSPCFIHCQLRHLNSSLVLSYIRIHYTPLYYQRKRKLRSHIKYDFFICYTFVIVCVCVLHQRFLVHMSEHVKESVFIKPTHTISFRISCLHKTDTHHLISYL
jgi:hypothetical protein